MTASEISLSSADSAQLTLARVMARIIAVGGVFGLFVAILRGTLREEQLHMLGMPDWLGLSVLVGGLTLCARAWWSGEQEDLGMIRWAALAPLALFYVAHIFGAWHTGYLVSTHESVFAAFFVSLMFLFEPHPGSGSKRAFFSPRQLLVLVAALLLFGLVVGLSLAGPVRNETFLLRRSLFTGLFLLVGWWLLGRSILGGHDTIRTSWLAYLLLVAFLLQWTTHYFLLDLILLHSEIQPQTPGARDSAFVWMFLGAILLTLMPPARRWLFMLLPFGAQLGLLMGIWQNGTADIPLLPVVAFLMAVVWPARFFALAPVLMVTICATLLYRAGDHAELDAIFMLMALAAFALTSYWRFFLPKALAQASLDNDNDNDQVRAAAAADPVIAAELARGSHRAVVAGVVVAAVVLALGAALIAAERARLLQEAAEEQREMALHIHTRLQTLVRKVELALHAFARDVQVRRGNPGLLTADTQRLLNRLPEHTYLHWLPGGKSRYRWPDPIAPGQFNIDPMASFNRGSFARAGEYPDGFWVASLRSVDESIADRSAFVLPVFDVAAGDALTDTRDQVIGLVIAGVDLVGIVDETLLLENGGFPVALHVFNEGGEFYSSLSGGEVHPYSQAPGQQHGDWYVDTVALNEGSELNARDGLTLEIRVGPDASIDSFVISVTQPLLLGALVLGWVVWQWLLRSNRELVNSRIVARTGEHLLRTQAAAGMGSWTWNLADDTISADGALLDAVGGKRQRSVRAREDINKESLPEERDRIVTFFDAIRDGQRTSERFVHRIALPDGAIRWMEVSGITLDRDESGAPAFVRGLTRDVTEIVELQQSLQQEKLEQKQVAEAFADAIEVSGLGFFELDYVGGQHHFSPSMLQIHGVSEEQLEQADPAEVLDELLESIDPADRAGLVASISGDVDLNPEWFYRVVRKSDGKVRKVRAKVRRRFDKQGLRLKSFGLVQDVTELEERADEAEALNRAKSQFISNVSHEMRTPLNSIIGNANLLANSALDDDQREHLVQLSAGAHQLLSEVNDLLDLSKMELGEFSLSKEPFQLVSAVNLAVNVMAVRAKQKGLTFRVQPIPPELGGWYVGDALRLRQMLLKLVSNAVKFTERGEVNVTVAPVAKDTPGQQRIRIEVRDTGIGIAEKNFPRLFNRFEQLDSGDERRFGGTGMGLAVVRQLAELMNGRVDVQSKVNVGSSFGVEVELPIASVEEKPDAKELVPSDPGDIAGLRALVVDDSSMNRKVLSRLLTKAGVLVDTAEDGQQSVDYMFSGEHDPDVILMDIQMPVMDGIEATGVIRADPRFSALPIIAVTAETTGGTEQRALDAGMNAYAAKPIDIEALSITIRSLVNEYRGASVCNDSDEAVDELAVASPEADVAESPEQAPVKTTVRKRLVQADDSDKWPELVGIDTDFVKRRFRGQASRFLNYLDVFVRSFDSISRAMMTRDSDLRGRALKVALKSMRTSANVLRAAEIEMLAARCLQAIDDPAGAERIDQSLMQLEVAMDAFRDGYLTVRKAGSEELGADLAEAPAAPNAPEEPEEPEEAATADVEVSAAPSPEPSQEPDSGTAEAPAEELVAEPRSPSSDSRPVDVSDLGTLRRMLDAGDYGAIKHFRSMHSILATRCTDAELSTIEMLLERLDFQAAREQLDHLFPVSGD